MLYKYYDIHYLQIYTYIIIIKICIRKLSFISLEYISKIFFFLFYLIDNIKFITRPKYKVIPQKYDFLSKH